MVYWTFLDFVDGQRNGIQEWIEGLNRGVRKAVKAELNARLPLLAKCSKLDRPDTGQLRGKKYAGLFEIVMKVGGVQYRPLWCYGPQRGEVTLLTGAIEKGGRMPNADCDRALRRMGIVHSGDRRYVCEHDYS